MTTHPSSHSYVGYVTACRGNVLLGGHGHHQSARFATQELAWAWTHRVVKANCEAHRPVSASGWTRMEGVAPEIVDEHDPEMTDRPPLSFYPREASDHTETGDQQRAYLWNDEDRTDG